MSKDYTATARATMDRLRTYRAYVRSQPQTGWGHDASRNGHLQMTAMAGAGI